MTFTILHGNNLDILPTLPDNSVDSIVTDPPYELGFMGKKWDISGIAYSVELWAECLRVLKPGGHLLSFGGTRTFHRVAVAIEDAGFEIRDNIAWLYGSGFPKSLDVSKAIQKASGVEPVGSIDNKDSKFMGDGWNATPRQLIMPETEGDAKKWSGFGTALKPAHEPIIVARKPLIGTVANNVLTHGTGALNIDGSRIGAEGGTKGAGAGAGAGIYGDGLNGERGLAVDGLGRWPANIILDEHTAGLLNGQSGVSASKATNRGLQCSGSHGGLAGESKELKEGTDSIRGHNGSGGASRFFYVAKASKRDRNEGLEDLPKKQAAFGGHGNNEQDGMTKQLVHAPRQNFHPTVKPTALMEYLVKLVTPPNGTVLDPFTGSGSTGKAAILNGFDFIGIEMTEDYLPIIKARLKHAEATYGSQIRMD